jgi:hypothetical protein
VSSKAVRVVGTSIIVVVCAVVGIAVLAAVMEFSGLSHRLDRKLRAGGNAPMPLHETGYYGQPLDRDPYRLLTVQHLHPYYLFSLPWLPDDIAAANSAVVTIDDSGFRTSGVPDGEATAILLGGSVAFGDDSSSDRHTLAWRLNELTPYRFANRNAPSWNSHQELVAAAKFPYPYELSLSLSLQNDIGLYCFHNGNDRIPDKPESFDRLASYFDDIEAKPLTEIEQASFLRRLLPDTFALLDGLTAATPDPAAGGRSVSDDVGKFCAGEREDFHARAIAATFLRNEKRIGDLASAIGAVHLVVLQPSVAFLDPASAVAIFNRLVYDYVLADPWCRDRCLDLSTIPGVTAADRYDGTNAATAIFADRVHLTDRGVEEVLKAIVPFVLRPR